MSSALLPRLRIWTLLLLAVIGLQAASPIARPLEQEQGSAFSAQTIDVALAPGRTSIASTTGALQLTPPTAPAEIQLPAIAYALAPTPRLRPEARGPPPRDHPARVPDSTAPPLA